MCGKPMQVKDGAWHSDCYWLWYSSPERDFAYKHGASESEQFAKFRIRITGRTQ